MSRVWYVPARQRWAARSMVVTKWLAGPSISSNEPICEIDTDGIRSTVIGPPLLDSDDPSGVLWRYVEEGAEIGPRGNLFEYTNNTSGGQNRLHSTARRHLLRRERYPQIFLSYRREDADAYAGRLHEVLMSKFGPEEVFMDLFSIKPGEVYPWVIQQAVVHAQVMVALIGPRWATLPDAYGQPRLDSEADWLRRELMGALDRGLPILPVLLPGAQLPTIRNGFDELRTLLDLQFHQITGPRHWNSDVADLVAAILPHVRQA